MKGDLQPSLWQSNLMSRLRCWTERARHSSTARGFGNSRKSGQNDAGALCQGIADERAGRCCSLHRLRHENEAGWGFQKPSRLVAAQMQCCANSRSLRITQSTQIDVEEDTAGPGPSHEEIALRAYQLWEERGKPHGSDEEDWHLAERQLQAGRPFLKESIDALL